MPPPPSPRFGGPPSGALAFFPLDTLTAVYDRRSGATHLVAEPLPALLAALDEGSADAAALLGRLAERFAVAGDADALAARLDELAALGLIAREAG